MKDKRIIDEGDVLPFSPIQTISSMDAEGAGSDFLNVP
jgi:hypothetical protein